MKHPTENGARMALVERYGGQFDSLTSREQDALVAHMAEFALSTDFTTWFVVSLLPLNADLKVMAQAFAQAPLYRPDVSSLDVNRI